MSLRNTAQKPHFIFKIELVLANVFFKCKSDICPFLRTPQDNVISSASEEAVQDFLNASLYQLQKSCWEEKTENTDTGAQRGAES